MRTRTQISVWATARQQQPPMPHAPPTSDAPAQRKRKLPVSTGERSRAVPPPPTSFPTQLTADAPSFMSIQEYISPASKKVKVAELSAVHAIPTVTCTTQQPQTLLFKTPMKKKPQLYADSRMLAQPTEGEELGERKSILDYISPNSKKAKTEVVAEKVVAVEQPSPQQSAYEATTKRMSIRRTLSYGSESDVLSDASVDSRDDCELAYAAPNAGVLSDPESILHRLCGSRAANSKLAPIVGRAAEQAKIASVLDASVGSRSLFIIGPPGTGKSSSVNQLLSGYERRFPANAVIRLNCSMFTNPVALYAEVDAQLRRFSPWKLPYLDPCLLDEFLSDASRASVACDTVLVLDEVDQLLRLPPTAQKRVQDVLRFLARWSALPTAKFTFLGIMNGLDMHAQLTAFLPQDLHVPHVLFPAYTYSELLAILTAHVENAAGETGSPEGLIELRALELIARKVASRDGDVRRATTLLQQSARLCLRRSAESGAESDALIHTITLRDVLACTTALLSAGPARDVQQLPRLPKILLYAITKVAPSDGKPSTMDVVSRELERLRAAPGFAWVPYFKREELHAHLATLECYALVKRPARAAKNFWAAKLTSAVTLDVVSKAMQDDALLRTLPQSSS